MAPYSVMNMAEPAAEPVPEIIPVIWWVFMVQGILAIVFGGAALLWTSLVVDLVAYFIGALFILYSISTVIRGIRGSGKHRTGLVVIGLLGILIGIFAVVHIYVLWITIGLLIAIWALLTGFGDLWLALTAQRGGSFRALLFVAGVLSLLLGFTVGLFPALGTLVMVQVIGIFLVAMGIAGIINGLLLRKAAPV
jgi:uncharacterized membrane protein HdeD (DUF308 family)